ncbi:MAG: polysaccharide biosynthesis tyrosine autokinase [Alphaproteobacteria bacterium]|nr:polysaccharide biosynthesis tyrosine autokinase [Alphaproteobacteria bacterium]
MTNLYAIPTAPGDKPQNPGGQLVSEIDLRQVLRTLWRRKSVIFTTVFLVTILATLIAFQLTPKYTASTKVMIDTRTNRTVDMEAVLSGLSADAATILSEIEILTSRSLVARLVTDLRLRDVAEFNASLRPEGFFAATLAPKNWWPESWMDWNVLYRAVFETQPARAMNPAEAEDQINAGAIGGVLAGLTVAPVSRSYVIKISFRSEDPRRAALIANGMADHYIVDQLEAKFEATRRATKWLNDRLGDLREKVRNSEKAVEYFREKKGLVRGKDSSISTQRLSELNTQLILATSARAEAEARYLQAKELLNSKDGVESAAEVLSSALIQNLKGEEAKVLRRASELSTRYGERHPKMINSRAELRDIEKKIGLEVSRIAKNLENEVAVAHARERSLRASLAKLEKTTTGHGRSEIQLRALEREAAANRLLFESFLNRFKETSQQAELQQADARIISRAEIPVAASFPKKRLIIAIALVGSAFLGVLLVFVLERLDNGFRTAGQIEQQTGVPSLGMIPKITGKANKVHVDRYVIYKPTSSASESIRSIRTSIMLSDVDNPPKVISLTSTLPYEGKTMLSLNLARVAAASGQRVLLIDGDLRRPRLHKSLGIANDKSIVELLNGELQMDEVCHVEDGTGLVVIPGKAVHANPMDLLNSHAMRNLVNGLRGRYDQVIIDAPPILAVSDIKVIGQYSDKIIYCIKWNDTPREAAVAGLRQVIDAHLPLAGTVLTHVDVKKHAQYGYGDSGDYYGRHKEYYAD